MARLGLGEKDRQVGRNLAQLRNQAGLSQEQVAAEFAISSQQLSKYECGQNRIAHVLWEDLVEFLKEQIRTLHGFHEDQAPYLSERDRGEEIETILQMAASLREQVDELTNRMRMVLGKSN
ncbi:MAG: helix-turn-helix domain-containing protein [Rhizobiaceae bacterium]|nr:helix-turn-helix domain-containing protein [Rhizobiaceae bacterium]